MKASWSELLTKKEELERGKPRSLKSVTTHFFKWQHCLQTILKYVDKAILAFCGEYFVFISFVVLISFFLLKIICKEFFYRHQELVLELEKKINRERHHFSVIEVLKDVTELASVTLLPRFRN